MHKGIDCASGNSEFEGTVKYAGEEAIRGEGFPETASAATHSDENQIPLNRSPNHSQTQTHVLLYIMTSEASRSASLDDDLGQEHMDGLPGCRTATKEATARNCEAQPKKLLCMV